MKGAAFPAVPGDAAGGWHPLFLSELSLALTEDER